jgi:hypothetical protein
MSVYLNSGNWTAECDLCSDVHDLGLYASDGFGMAISQMRDDGWEIRRKHDEWEHVCPECAAHEKEADFGEVDDDD